MREKWSIYLFFVVLVGILASGISVTFYLDSFNNSLITETLKFNGNSNIYRYLSIDQNSDVITATLNLSSFRENYFEIFYNDTELTNTTNQSGTYVQIKNNASAFDENWDTYANVSQINDHCISACSNLWQTGSFLENFSIPANYPLVNLTLEQKYGYTFNTQINGGTIGYNISCKTNTGTWNILNAEYLIYSITGSLIYTKNYSLPPSCINGSLIILETSFTFLQSASYENGKMTGDLYETHLLIFNQSNINGSYLEIGTPDGDYEWAIYENTYVRNDTELTGAGNGTEGFDENWSSYVELDSPNMEVRENWSIPLNVGGLNWTVSGSRGDNPAQFNGYCWNYTSSSWSAIFAFGLGSSAPLANRTYNVPNGCINGTILSTRIEDVDNGGFVHTRYYESLIEYIDQQVTTTALFNNTDGEKTDDFSTKLENVISFCNCNNCTLVGNTCLVPFQFHSNTNGIMQYFNLSINYSLTKMPSIINDRCINCNYSNSAYTEANITDSGSLNITYANFSVFLGNGSILFNNQNGSLISGNTSGNIGQIWRSQNFSIPYFVDYYVNWSWNITVRNNVSHFNESNGSFPITVNPDLNTTYPLNGTAFAANTFTINSTVNFSGLAGNCFYSLQYVATGLYEVQNQTLNCTTNSITTSLATEYIVWVWSNNSHNKLNLSRTSISISNVIVVTTGGGGGGGSPAIIKPQCPKNPSWFADQRSVANLVPKGTYRNRFFCLTNNGTEETKISISCDDTSINTTQKICDYVNFSKSSIILKPNLQQEECITYTTYSPINATLGEEFFYGIALDDKEGCSKTISVSNSISFVATTIIKPFQPGRILLTLGYTVIATLLIILLSVLLSSGLIAFILTLLFIVAYAGLQFL